MTAQHALKAFRTGDYKLAAEGFARAQAEYRDAGNALMAAEMANNRAVALMAMNDGAGALQAVEPTVDVFKFAGDRMREAQARGNLAAACAKLGDLDRAEREFRSAVEAFEALGDTDQRAAALRSLSEVQLRKGRPLDAVSSMQAGLDGVKRPSMAQRAARQLLALPFRLLRR